MHTLTDEFLKLRRSLSWVVVLLLPVSLVVAGSVLTLVSGEPLEDGWDTLWMRSFVFYGLFPLPVGIAILASLVWRPEHRGTTWNALMGGPASCTSLVVAKATTIALLAMIMQVIALVTVVVLGTLAFGLPGLPPARFLGVLTLIMLACVPVAAVQSWLSMVIRPFAVPVAVAFVGAGLSSVLITAGFVPVMVVSPYGVLTRATQLGTATFADSGAITALTVVLIVVGSLALAAAFVGIASVLLERRDVRT